ncbi:MAG: 2-hydroxyacyl-CoA dehydratase family protein [Chloroflexota bacterium]|mgnify:CR=1 FL=1
MAVSTVYPTRPLECWGKMKELRRHLNRQAWEVREKGGVVVASQDPPYPIIAGLGGWARRLYGPYFATAMKDPELLVQYHEVADGRGFPRGEMCSSMHHYVGEMLLGLTTKNPRTGDTSPVDLVIDVEFCHSVAKTAQLAGELLGVPCFVLDVPQESSEAAVKYTAARMHDAVDFLVKATGKEFRDEWLVEAVKNYWEQGAIIARICLANQAVPAPLDFRMLHELRVPSVVAGHLPEVVSYVEEVLAEVEGRVREGISATGVEAARLSYEGEPMFYAEDFVPGLARRYGAVIVAGFTAFTRGMWDISPDGQWTPAPRFKELGVELKDRQDALEFLARCYVHHRPLHQCARLDQKPTEYLHRAQDWHCHGTILHLDIGCRNQTAGMLEARSVLEAGGIATVAYESSNGDPRCFSPQQVADRLESFLERLGLRPIEG